jgi:hypothetical protein
VLVLLARFVYRLLWSGILHNAHVAGC